MSAPTSEASHGQFSGQYRAALERAGREQWLVEPDVGRVAHGIPARVDRLRALGNALVPQIAQWLGEQILAYEEED
jgi:site-specific DNA-cytosine methylase